MSAPLPEIVWLLAVALPLVLGLACHAPRLTGVVLLLAPWAALPALLAALWPPPARHFPWLLLGADFGLDGSTRIFLLFTALLWICGGIYARAYLGDDAQRPRFFAYYLATMGGNLGLIMVQDLVSFYLFFVLMTFAAYGLVVQDRSAAALRAGRIYLLLAVFGEALLIAGLLLAAAAAASLALGNIPAAVATAPHGTLTIALLLAGFGIKAGALPLHVWMPLIYPAAPTPARAVLAGAMVNAGIIGWLRFLPLGEGTFPAWGTLCLVGGLLAAFYGVAIGLTQESAKTVLAYSSVSQMGLLTAVVGIGFLQPQAWPAALLATTSYALHHGLAKGSLFLGLGMAGGGRWGRRFYAAGMVLGALALAGAPLTSGAAAKQMLGRVAAFAPYPWPGLLGWLLTLAAVGTALLMTHLLLLLWRRPTIPEPAPAPGQWWAWSLLLAAMAGLLWLLLPMLLIHEPPVVLWGYFWGALWPVLLGAALAWGLWRLGEKRGRPLLPQVPAGDLLALVERLVARWQSVSQKHVAPRLAAAIRSYHLLKWRPIDIAALRVVLDKGEAGFGRWSISGIAFLFLLVLLSLLLLW
jgi:formate hydrogenlyase subunit 3/multisubunit Na+/H+ antiporter MnhD subunit